MSGYNSPYETCPEICANIDEPGLALDLPLWVDHAHLETTVDQASIEAALSEMELGGKRLLHVGVGNSQLAQQFAQQFELIDGLTVSENELRLAKSVQIDTYTVFFVNKYSREFVLAIKNKYDFIVDNNLASFACCKFHFYRMLDNYLWALRPGGQILTDQRGMDWVVEDPRWKLNHADLCALERKFPVKVTKISETVFSLTSVKRSPGV
jgi:hypothetical protein